MHHTDNYNSCFISYSSADKDFAEKLYADLTSVGIQCWFAPEDMHIGAQIRPTLDKAIIARQKLLLVLSENSISSAWVEQEVETAFEKERAKGELVLFPIALDDAVFRSTIGWAAFIKRTRHVGDFRSWRQVPDYQRALQRVMRDLQRQNTD